MVKVVAEVVVLEVALEEEQEAVVADLVEAVELLVEVEVANGAAGVVEVEEDYYSMLRGQQVWLVLQGENQQGKVLQW